MASEELDRSFFTVTCKKDTDSDGNSNKLEDHGVDAHITCFTL